jgi:hypothetical protein
MLQIKAMDCKIQNHQPGLKYNPKYPVDLKLPKYCEMLVKTNKYWEPSHFVDYIHVNLFSCCVCVYLFFD